MKAGKDIDSIFRDRFKGAKMPPPQDSLENIFSQLPQKEEKRKVFPLWVRAAGVAAVLTVIFTLVNSPAKKEATGISFSQAPGKTEMFAPETTATFNRVMQESSILLQALILKSQDLQLLSAGGQFALAAEEVNITGTKASGRTEPLQPGINVQQTQTEVIVSEESFAEKLSEEIIRPQEIAEVIPAVKEEEPVDPQSKSKRSEGNFKLSTRVAPVYFSSLGSGNAVDNNFSHKSAAGEVTFSYGLSIAYVASGKINIRMGINKVDLAYNTREVSYNEVAAANYGGENLKQSTMLASPVDGTLSQKMGFLEVPLEVEYMLLDSKFALGLIGGGSALILEKNEVSLDTFGNKVDFEQSSNTNNLSFTTNLGLSLGYDISRQLQMSLEPVVKLQMNTFRNSGDSSPYFFGIYSGLSYRF